MSRRSLRRRAAAWLAGVFVISVISLNAGCRWVPVRRVAPGLDPRVAGPVNRPQAAPEGRPTEMASLQSPPVLPPLPEEDARAFAQVRMVESLPATPLLDEALRRAEALEEALVNTSPHDFPILNPPAARETPVATSPTVAEPATLILPRDLPVSEVAASDTEFTNSDLPAPAEDEKPWLETLLSLRALAREEAEVDGEGAEVWRSRAELLDHLIERGAPEEDQTGEALETVLALLAAPWPVDPALTRVRTAVEATESAPAVEAQKAPEIAEVPETPSLTIANLQFCREVRGFGDYEPEPDRSLKQGQVVFMYNELESVAYEPRGRDVISRIEARVEILPADDSDSRAVWRLDLPVAEDITRRPRRDYYVNYKFALPTAERVPPGRYRLRLTQIDAISGQQTEAFIPLALTTN